MKIKKKYIVIPTFALLISASVAGSVSGTLAWYQYSTRTNAAYVGISGGESGNLQIRFQGQDDDHWATRLTFKEVNNWLDATTDKIGSDLAPITSGNMSKDDGLPNKFYGNPIYGHTPYDQWKEASVKNYVVLPLELRFVEKNNGQSANVSKNIYLSDLTIQDNSNNILQNKKDLSNAIRVHIHSEGAGENVNHLISKNGGETLTNGKLDLSGDGKNDQRYNGSDKRYGFDGGELEDLVYGYGKQESYAVSDLTVTPSENDLSLNGVTPEKVIGKTVADGVLKLDIAIWVEGWQKFDDSPIWDSNYIGSRFDVGFEFAINPAEE